MANTAKFSIFYKARVVKAIVGSSKTLHAFGVNSTGQSPADPTNVTVGATPGASTLGTIASGSIPFADIPTEYSTTGAEISNSGPSAQLTIPAGSVVHFVGLATGSTLYAYVKLTSPDTNYYYEEQGTLTIPTGGYTVRHA